MKKKRRGFGIPMTTATTTRGGGTGTKLERRKRVYSNSKLRRARIELKVTGKNRLLRSGTRLRHSAIHSQTDDAENECIEFDATCSFWCFRANPVQLYLQKHSSEAPDGCEKCGSLHQASTLLQVSCTKLKNQEFLTAPISAEISQPTQHRF